MKKMTMKNTNKTLFASLLFLGLSQVTLAQNSTVVTDAVGTQELWAFDEILNAHKMTSRINQVDGKGITQTWDRNGNKLSRTDSEGRVMTYTYNATNQRLSMTEASGTSEARTTTYEYVNADIDLVTKVTSPSIYANQTKEVINTYDDSLNVVAVTINGVDATGSAVTRQTTFAYDGLGKVTQINGPRTDVQDITRLEYYNCDTGVECGQLASVTNALGHVTSYDDYDAAARLLQSTDTNGVITTYTYHPRGWVLSMRQTPPTGAARVTTYDYDNVGQLIKTTYPDGTEHNYDYDAAHELREISDNLGNKVTYKYDAKGNRNEELVFDPDGTLINSIETTYDIRNFITSINNGGSITQLLNDAVGNLSTQEDPNENPENEYDFDALDRLTNMVDSLGNSTSNAYDVADQLISATAPNGATTQYEYDDLGNMTKEISPDRGTIIYTHDDAGNVTSMTDARGITTQYTYDALNRLTNITYPTASENISYQYDIGTYAIGYMHQASDDSGTRLYEYDPWGNVIHVENQLRNDSNALLGSFVTQYAYDAQDRVISIVYPNGRQVTTSRDAIGRLSALQTSVNGQSTNVITNRVYRADGLWVSQAYGNGLTQTKEYDLQGRLIEQDSGSYQRDYQYDNNGNILDIDARDNSHEVDYDYDVLDRLVFTRNFLADQTQGFDYDPNGNREQFSEDGTISNLAYELDSNRLANIDGSNLTLDASGRTLTDNQSRQYTYNDVGRLRSLSVNNALVGQYTYNSYQLRTHKTVDSSTTLYHYDLAGNLILETDAQGEVIQEYIYADGERVATVAASSGNSVALSNLALGKAVAQSSTASGGAASRAVDGNTNGVWRASSVTHTSSLAQSWWQVDLGLLADIQNVTLHNRTDNCCRTRLIDFYVFVSSSPFDSNATVSDLLDDPTVTNTFHAGTLSGNNVNLPLAARGQYVRVQLAGTGVLSLAEVEVFGSQAVTLPLTNVAEGKPTVQSSTGSGGLSNRAVDGKTDGVWRNRSVTHTTTQAQSWWQVDLEQSSDIASVTLYNRTDNCCRARLIDFYVFVSDVPFGNQSLDQILADSSIARSFHAGTLAGDSVSLPVTASGQYVRVQLSGTGVLSLAEVDVQGAPATGGTVNSGTNSVASLQYYINDHLMTPQQLIDENQNITWQATYEAFGNVDITTENVVNNHRFPGQYYDAESGLYYNWNRYYDPVVGRYVTSDPIGLGGGLNTFGYVGGNPLVFYDYKGLSEQDVIDINNAFTSAVDNMTNDGDRHPQGIINNINRGINTFSFGFFGEPFLGCINQSNYLLYELNNLDLDDPWEFRPKSRKFPFPHTWIEAIPGNPSDPRGELDPWKYQFKWDYPSSGDCSCDE